MRDKKLQKELWSKNESIKTLDNILGIIRASEAASDHQNSLTRQTKEVTKTIKCFNFDKTGHKVAGCPTKKPATKPTNQNFGCGFCGGKEWCSYKNYRA